MFQHTYLIIKIYVTATLLGGKGNANLSSSSLSVSSLSECEFQSNGKFQPKLVDFIGSGPITLVELNLITNSKDYSKDFPTRCPVRLKLVGWINERRENNIKILASHRFSI